MNICLLFSFLFIVVTNKTTINFCAQAFVQMNAFFWASLVVHLVKICLQCRRHRFDPWVGKIPWGRKQQPTPVFLPGESHGQKSLAGYSPWGHKKLDMTQQLNHHHHAFFSLEEILWSEITRSCGSIF